MRCLECTACLYSAFLDLPLSLNVHLCVLVCMYKYAALSPSLHVWDISRVWIDVWCENSVNQGFMPSSFVFCLVSFPQLSCLGMSSLLHSLAKMVSVYIRCSSRGCWNSVTCVINIHECVCAVCAVRGGGKHFLPTLDWMFSLTGRCCINLHQ